jgi:hypothetical protein
MLVRGDGRRQTLMSAARPMILLARLAAMALLVVSPRRAATQELTIGIIDLYGLRHVAAADVRRSLTFKIGDPIDLDGGKPPSLIESERRIAALPAVARARTSVICCDSGRLIVYVGVEEQGVDALSFRPAPTGSVRLPDDVLEASDEFDTAFTAAIQRGDTAEDDSQGHALMHDPASRAIQLRYIAFAARDQARLRQVLRESAEADQRALAAMVLGYAKDKAAVVEALVEAMADPSEDVRNNAARALMVFTRMTVSAPPPVPAEPFIRLIGSPIWTDRNKGSAALAELTASHNPSLLDALSRPAIHASLVEMARWTSAGHALAAFMILGRIDGLSDEDLHAAWNRGDRESVITRTAPPR